MDPTLGLGGSVWDFLQDLPPSALNPPGRGPLNPPGQGIPGRPGGINEFKTILGRLAENSPFTFSEETRPTNLFDNSSTSTKSGPSGKTTLFGSPESIGLGIEIFEDPSTPKDPVIFGGKGAKGGASFKADLIGEEMEMEVLSSESEILDVGAFSSSIEDDDDDLQVFKGRGQGPGRG